jgi:hypothetical protein
MFAVRVADMSLLVTRFLVVSDAYTKHASLVSPYQWRVFLLLMMPVVNTCHSDLSISDACSKYASLITSYQWRVFTRHWCTLITDARTVTRLLRVTDRLDASLIAFSGIVGHSDARWMVDSNLVASLRLLHREQQIDINQYAATVQLRLFATYDSWSKKNLFLPWWVCLVK